MTGLPLSMRAVGCWCPGTTLALWPYADDQCASQRACNGGQPIAMLFVCGTRWSFIACRSRGEGSITKPRRRLPCDYELAARKVLAKAKSAIPRSRGQQSTAEEKSVGASLPPPHSTPRSNKKAAPSFVEATPPRLVTTTSLTTPTIPENRIRISHDEALSPAPPGGARDHR